VHQGIILYEPCSEEQDPPKQVSKLLDTDSPQTSIYQQPESLSKAFDHLNPLTFFFTELEFIHNSCSLFLLHMDDSA